MTFDLESDNFVPSWYELSIDKNILFINIHKIAWLFFVNILGKNEKIINDYKEQFFKAYKNNLNFIFPNLKRPWGFGEIITFCFENNDWVSFKCKLPQNCENGNLFLENVNQVYLRLTLKLLFTVLKAFNQSTGCKKPQLIMINSFNVEFDGQGGSDAYWGTMEVVFSPEAAKYISKQQQDFFYKIKKSMIIYKKINEVYLNDFVAKYVPPKYLYLNVPGQNGCCLYPYYDNRSLNVGFTLHPHNIDTGSQQLCLLAGIAKINDLIRKTL